jgi:hypothetical protein
MAALQAEGGPDGLTVVRRTSSPTESDALPRIMVSRVREAVQSVFPNQRVSPLVDRRLTVRLDMWATPVSPVTDPEEAMEPLLAWATAQMTSNPAWSGLAVDTTEDSTEWEINEDVSSIGHAWMDFTIRFPTKTSNQEQKQ